MIDRDLYRTIYLGVVFSTVVVYIVYGRSGSYPFEIFWRLMLVFDAIYYGYYLGMDIDVMGDFKFAFYNVANACLVFSLLLPVLAVPAIISYLICFFLPNEPKPPRKRTPRKKRKPREAS